MVAGQVLSNLLGVDDANVDEKAEKFATKLGLKPENTLAQTAVYLVTKAAVLEGLQLIGIGLEEVSRKATSEASRWRS